MTRIRAQQVFDGVEMQLDKVVTLKSGKIQSITDGTKSQLPCLPGLLAPGFVDLQVNGGGGVMLNDGPSPEVITKICDAHAGLGATHILPTLITDTPEKTAAAISAAVDALSAQIPGIAGLHLEGPHLAPARKGAHRGELMRPMSNEDVALYVAAKKKLPALKLTVATEAVSPDQIATLTRAGCLVSIGHSNASYADVMAAVEAGASCVTHLFNAMSPLTSREPGLVGAALDSFKLSMGLIADGHHVSPPSIRAALRANRGPGAPFLVSDSMATGGADITEFFLDRRAIRKNEGRLTLVGGTLAGAHLPLARAIRNLVDWGAADLETALAMATRIPADLINRPDIGRIEKGARADLVLLNREDMSLEKVWRGGQPIALSPS